MKFTVTQEPNVSRWQWEKWEKWEKRERGQQYPEGTVGNVDVAPGDNDGVFDGFGGNVYAEEGAVSVIGDLDVDGETFSVLKEQTHNIQQVRTLLPVHFTSLNHNNKVFMMERYGHTPSHTCSSNVQRNVGSHLSVELQLSSASSVGVDGEVGGFVDDAAERLQPRSITPHLRRRKRLTRLFQRHVVVQKNGDHPGLTFSGKTSAAAGRM